MEEQKTKPLSETFHNLKWINWVCLGLNTKNGKEEPLFTTREQVKQALKEFKKVLYNPQTTFDDLEESFEEHFGELVE